MRTIGEITVRALLPVMMGAVFVLTAETAMDELITLAKATPHVGDILSFDAAPGEATAVESPRFIVHRPDASGCVLDLSAMRQFRGSLVVESEAMAPENAFRVHWAGERTTAGAGNCGSSADLIVDSRELKILALGAAGYADRSFSQISIGEVAN